MYLATDDARSDFFLAAAVYVIGPVLYSALLRSTGSLLRSDVVVWVLAVAAPILLISAMPLYLMRYRDEGFGTLTRGSADAAARAVVVMLPLVGAVLLGDLVAGTNPIAALAGTFQVPILLVSRVVRWLSLAVLAVFLYRRAEYAFRPISEQMTVLVTRAAAATVGAAIVASLLLAVRDPSLGLVLAPVGMAGAVYLATRLFPPAGMGEQWQVYAPLITLALGPLDLFSLLLSPLNFLEGLRVAGMVAGFGLIVILGLQAGRGGRFAMVLGLVVALLTSVPGASFG